MSAPTLPTWDELSAAGIDAGAVLDACEAEFERACGAATDKATRTRLSDDVKRV